MEASFRIALLVPRHHNCRISTIGVVGFDILPEVNEDPQ